MNPETNDLSVTCQAFNVKKFYPGRAIRLHGISQDGDTVDGNYLIKSVDIFGMRVISSFGREFMFMVDDFLPGEDEPYVFVEFYGEDKP